MAHDHEALVKGKTILSCGHEDEHGCMGVSVQFDDEQCVAGEGFVPTTVYAQYCHECAIKLYYEIGKDTGRAEAGLQADLIEQQAARIAELSRIITNAPIIGTTETAAAFRKRQDTWLNEHYSAVIGDKQ